MRRLLLSLFTLTFLVSLLALPNQAEARYWHKKKASTGGKADADESKKKKEKEKPFATVIKDFEKVEGLFDFYIDEEEDKIYMAVKPDQLEEIYLCNVTRSAGDGTYFDGGAMSGSFPFKFSKVGKKIQFVEVNLRFRADSTAAISGALKRSISNSIRGTAKIASKPDSNGAILIDPTEIFITDIPNVAYFLGQKGKTGHKFDKENSRFGTIKSFPQNSEIDIHLHYTTNKPGKSVTVAHYSSMQLLYHYSLSTVPETDFRPRLADERVGYFMTLYQDYTNLADENPYVRFINRWNLQKKDPGAALSEPVKPITWWVENTVPEEYRDLIADGVLWWNTAFEEIGFKNAMVVKQMPDTADWDPADIRFNVIRWIITPGSAYAVGPSRANPFTGEIYDADIRIMADFIRFMYNYSERFIEPISFGESASLSPFEHQEEQLQFECHHGDLQPLCTYQSEGWKHACEAIALLDARTLTGSPELRQKYVRQYIVSLVAHEVGHTLGLRHNFKASTIYTLEQRQDPAFTAKNGIHGSIMEYEFANIAPVGMPQGDFYNVVPGPYDRWAIEYGYKPIDAPSGKDEKEELDKIASRSGKDPYLVYSTDEDCFGNSPRAIDPYTAIWDLGNDPFEFWTNRITMSRELWSKVEQKFEKPGESYKKLRTVFNYGWGGFRGAGAHLARFIGGIDHNRYFVGDSDIGQPFNPIPAEEQRRAMNFLRENIWSDGVFNFDPVFINKLQPERLPDFTWSVYRMQRIDYPLHAQILGVQAIPLWHLYNPITLARLGDTETRYGKGEEVYTLTDMFTDIRRAIWTEVVAPRNVSSTRRNLQRLHLRTISRLVTDLKLYVPQDARTLARVDMRVLKGAISKALQSGNLDTITRGHFEDSLARINAAMNADVNVKL